MPKEFRKPEKKYLIPTKDGADAWLNLKTQIHNQLCDDWEKWLPSEKEIGKIILQKDAGGYMNIGGRSYQKICVEDLAKAISKRIRGE